MAAPFAMVLHGDGALRREAREPQAPRRGEVLIEMSASSVNYHDVLGVRGKYPNLPTPRVPFSDGCGRVIAVGDDVERVKIGDRVLLNFFPRWIAGAENADVRSVVFGDQIDGTLQSHLRTDASALVIAPPHLSDIEAATLACAGVTAWRSVVSLGGAKAGEVIVVEGTGGVALFALAFAKMAGASVILTSSSDEKLDRAKELGADEIINYRTHKDWAKEVLRLTAGIGADHIVDIGGPDTLPLAIKAARVGGRVSIIGARTGVDREPTFPVREVMRKNLTLRGLSVGARADFEAMCAAISRRHYRPHIGAILPANEAMKGIELMEAQTHMGKIAINIGSA